MTNQDASGYTLRYNEITGNLEVAIGTGWVPITFISGGVTDITTDGGASVAGSVNLVSGDGITLTTLGQDITIATAPNIVQNTNEADTLISTGSNTYVDTTFGVTITPVSATAKILVTFPNISWSATADATYAFTIFRGIGGTDLGSADGNGLAIVGSLVADKHHSLCLSILDSPNTTSPVTYELYGKTYGTGNLSVQDNGHTKMIAIAQEIH